MVSLIRFASRCGAQVRKRASCAERALNRILGVGCYRLDADSIVRRNGLWHNDKIAVPRIARWWVDHEMVFDVVSIELSSGLVVRWLDSFNDLLEILNRVAPEKWSESPTHIV